MNDVLILLGEAPTNRDLQVRILFLLAKHHAQIAVELVVGILTNRTGVKDHQIGVCVLGYALVTGSLKQSTDSLRIVNVHLAAVGANFVGKRHLLGF